MSKTEHFLSDCLELRHPSFPTFKLEPKHWLLLGLEPAGFQTGTYVIRSPESPGCMLKILGFHSLHNCMSQFLIINLNLNLSLSLSIFISYLFCFSGESWLIKAQLTPNTAQLGHRSLLRGHLVRGPARGRCFEPSDYCGWTGLGTKPESCLQHISAHST